MRGSAAPFGAWSRLREIFFGAVALPPEARGPFLARSCGGDEALRAQVEALLVEDEAAQPWLDSPQTGRPAALLPLGVLRPCNLELHPRQEPSEDLSGRRLGAYRLIRPIGRGGQSTVYLGERADGQFQQQAAVKVLDRNPGAELAPGGLERQILARLNHPAIARLFDAGVTSGGRPYFVMEYVEGQPIDVHCRQRRLSQGECLRLFLEICAAVQHAHQSLVVHSDLKPRNILVTAEGRPKLLDFGIARLESQAIFAEPKGGPRHALTPAYASPEQLRGEGLTAASDVYSLGLILRRLLEGSRIPSTGVEGRERSETRKLPPDLDAVVSKALSPETADRYPSVAELAADLERFLGHRPVEARRGGWPYRSSKWLRRRWGTALGLLLGLAVGAALGLQQWRMRQALAVAEHEQSRAAAVTEFLERLLEASNPNAGLGQELTVRQVLDQASRALSLELTGQPEVQAQLLETVGRTYQTLGHLDRAEEALEAAVRLRRKKTGDPHEGTAKALDRLAGLRLAQGRLEEAEALGKEALELRRRLFGERHLAVAESLNNLGEVYRDRGQLDRAEGLLKEAAELRRQLAGTESTAYLESLFELGLLHQDRGDRDGAVAYYRQALPLARHLLGEHHTETLQLSHDLAYLLQESEPELAEGLFLGSVEGYRRVLGEEHPWTATATRNLARLLRERQRFDEAEGLLTRVLETQRSRSPADEVYVAYVEEDIGRLHLKAGKPASAEPHFENALSLLRRNLLPDDWRIASTRSILGECLTLLDRPGEARPHLEAALPVLEDEFGPEGSRAEKTRQRLARLDEAATP
ncbi:MAG: serine/threonine protein kinase [Acidobacteria bacterium]|nr:serine/threonine protein kinase [Acidobacteriota bacterium]